MDSPKPSPLREIVQPFIDLVHAPRALWGINLPYLLEGMVYFGVLGYLAMFFNQYVGLTDQQAAWMVGVLTAGITAAMFFFGGMADRYGVRFALLFAFLLFILGRVLLSIGPAIGLSAAGMASPIHILSMIGIVLIAIGYGFYQPAAYAAVRQFTTPKTAAMGFAMLYALMNLGGWLPSFFGFIRRAIGISGALWVYTAITVVSLIATWFLLTKSTVRKATLEADASREPPKYTDDHGIVVKDLSCVDCGYNLRTLAAIARCPECGAPVQSTLELPPTAEERRTAQSKKPFDFIEWIVNHPLLNAKFTFFIFCLIPVQTLFAHNWLTLPMYVERAFRGSLIGKYFEFAVNLNPLLIFIFVPIVTALTQKTNVYKMMIYGTLIMALPTFILALGAKWWTLSAYLLLMTVGEAMWQPRFMQYAAEIAPEGRTGAYMGVAQLPWFLTKFIVPFYSGWFLENFCPAQGELHTEKMWLIYGLIAMSSTILLLLAKNWIGKDFKTKAD